MNREMLIKVKTIDAPDEYQISELYPSGTLVSVKRYTRYVVETYKYPTTLAVVVVTETWKNSGRSYYKKLTLYYTKDTTAESMRDALTKMISLSKNYNSVVAVKVDEAD